MPMRFIQISMIGICLLTLTSCSLSHIYNSLTSNYIEDEIALLNREKDLEKVRKQFPDNIEHLERLITENRNNKELHVFAAQAYYSYAFSFIEDTDIHHARSLYYQAYSHAISALAWHGISRPDLLGKATHLSYKISTLKREAVAALYWSALSWAKIIEIEQPNLLLYLQLNKTAILMNQVIKLDDTYNLYGPYLFFAMYYYMRPSFIGSNDFIANKYFNRARALNHNRLLIIDFLQLKYSNGRIKKETYTQRLQSIINAPVDLYPEQALMNAVAKQKALQLLSTSQNKFTNTH
jgi:TRAP transporter T-component